MRRSRSVSLHDRRLGVERLDLEAGDALVIGGDVFELLLRQHVGDDLVAIRRALLDAAKAIRWRGADVSTSSEFNLDGRDPYVASVLTSRVTTSASVVLPLI